jgi:hypothetical protein
VTNYTFGFSLTGLVIYLLQLAPNIVWLLRPPASNPMSRNSSPHQLLNAIEHVCGIAIVALLILVVNKTAVPALADTPSLILAALLILGYYASWILYYRGVVAPWLLVFGLAALPPLYFLCAGLWLENYLVVILSIPFLAAHVYITYANFWARH